MGTHTRTHARSCPGIYEACGAPMLWDDRFKFWSCERRLVGKCTYRYWPPPPVAYPQLSLDVVSDQEFKVRARASIQAGAGSGVRSSQAGKGQHLGRGWVWSQEDKVRARASI